LYLCEKPFEQLSGGSPGNRLFLTRFGPNALEQMPLRIDEGVKAAPPPDVNCF
jgi:hypothetical protein